VREVAIRGDTIRLGQLLKLAGVVGAGGELKRFLDGRATLLRVPPVG
jgi:ribosome-associated protein YbcJ (S4-like RNA binding protein)